MTEEVRVGETVAACASPASRLRKPATRETETTPMERYDEEWNQFATKIQKELHRRLKLHCVRTEVSVQDFVTRALREKLDHEGRRGRRD